MPRSSSNARKVAVRPWALIALGAAALLLGGLSVRNALADSGAESRLDGLHWSDVLLKTKDVLISAQGTLIEFDGTRSLGEEAEGARAPVGNTPHGFGASTATNLEKPAQLARTTAQEIARLKGLRGVGDALRSLDLEALETSFETAATQMSAKLVPQARQALRKELAAQLEAVEETLDEAEVEAEADEDGLVDGTEEEVDEEEAEGEETDGEEASAEEEGTTSMHEIVLFGALAFVFLNFGLLMVQMLRSKDVPKSVEDTFKASATFLIGASTSFWMS